jgi:NAD(P)-dependent dehydrogenase (short-subunit alcohol dehydrogenase family)
MPAPGSPRFLAGKAVLVTGGTRGIGRAIAEALLLEGARVAICGRTGDTSRSAAEDLARATGGDAVGLAADVSRPEEVSGLFTALARRWQGLDILINNAGIGVFRTAGELTPEEWQRVIGLNLSGPFYCVREALPLMEKAGGGYIIQIGSLAGKNAFATGAAYNASKFGLNGFSEALMLDVRYRNIRVSEIMPGSVDTDFSPRSGRADWKIAPEDVARVVVDLLRMPSRTLVSRVEMRPSQPRKS